MLIEPVEIFFRLSGRGRRAERQIQVGEGETQITAFFFLPKSQVFYQNLQRLSIKVCKESF